MAPVILFSGIWSQTSPRKDSNLTMCYTMAKRTEESYSVPMSEKENIPTRTCDICEGSGQVCSFRGVSRFVLTWEDCPICGGLGFTTGETQESDPDPKDEEKE